MFRKLLVDHRRTSCVWWSSFTIKSQLLKWAAAALCCWRRRRRRRLWGLLLLLLLLLACLDHGHFSIFLLFQVYLAVFHILIPEHRVFLHLLHSAQNSWRIHIACHNHLLIVLICCYIFHTCSTASMQHHPMRKWRRRRRSSSNNWQVRVHSFDPACKDLLASGNTNNHQLGL